MSRFPSIRPFCAPLAALTLAGLIAAPSASANLIPAESESYRVLYRQFQTSSQISAFEPATTDELNISVQDFGGFSTEFYRPILQFDISGMTEPVDEAKLRVYATFIGATDQSIDFDIEVAGSQDNRADVQAFDDPGATDEFFNSPNNNYVIAHDPTERLMTDADTAGQWYEIDVTGFVNDRFADFQSSGDSYVFFRLQPDEVFDLSDTVNTTYRIASGDSDNTPLLVIPEPTTAALLALGGLALIRRRRTA